MNSSGVDIQEPRAQFVSLTDEELRVDLVDGRTVIVPLVWYPRLWHGSEEERNNFEIFGDGVYIHWPSLDEDLTVLGLLEGKRSGESAASLKKWLASKKAAGRMREREERKATHEQNRTQRVTAVDLENGRIRIPSVNTALTKNLFPKSKANVELILRNRPISCSWDPRMGPDRERSGVLQIGPVLRQLVKQDEVLTVSQGEADTLVIE